MCKKLISGLLGNPGDKPEGPARQVENQSEEIAEQVVIKNTAADTPSGFTTKKKRTASERLPGLGL